MRPVKLIGVFHGTMYWALEFKNQINELLSGTRKLGIEICDSDLQYLKSEVRRKALRKQRERRNRKGKKWYALPNVEFPRGSLTAEGEFFFTQIVRFAEAKGIEIVPLISERIYSAITAKARPTFTGFAVPDRLKYSLQERSATRRIQLKRVDTAIMGADHIFGVKARLRLLKIPSYVIHFPKSHPMQDLEPKLARREESKQRKERRKRNIARGLLKPKSKRARPK